MPTFSDRNELCCVLETIGACARKNNFHMKGYAPRHNMKQRKIANWKWVIVYILFVRKFIEWIVGFVLLMCKG